MLFWTWSTFECPFLSGTGRFLADSVSRTRFLRRIVNFTVLRKYILSIAQISASYCKTNTSSDSHNKCDPYRWHICGVMVLRSILCHVRRKEKGDLSTGVPLNLSLHTLSCQQLAIWMEIEHQLQLLCVHHESIRNSISQSVPKLKSESTEKRTTCIKWRWRRDWRRRRKWSCLYGKASQASQLVTESTLFASSQVSVEIHPTQFYIK